MDPAKATYFACTNREFAADGKEMTFAYEIGFVDREPMRFVETVTLPKKAERALPAELLEGLLDDVHLMLGISYYKLYCPSEIRTRVPLSTKQKEFWSAVYRKGLGEFAYRNNLDLRDRIHFSGEGSDPQPVDLKQQERALVGIGGGKDSAVAVELMKDEGYALDGFIVETYTEHDIARKMCEVGGIEPVVIRRMLDEQLFGELPGSYKGHIPISAVYAFLGTLAAALYGHRFVVVSNEFSSNFGNIEHAGEMVNHQWSKSGEFEALFQDYIRTFRTPSVRYFSIVRPLYEIRIAELFSKYPQYFPHFTGCNRKFRIEAGRRPKGLWCGECPKCAFIFLMLAPFVPQSDLVKIFGKNMLDDRGLIPLFADILGYGNMKPFDCVGTFEEARVALYEVKHTYADSAVVNHFLLEGRVNDGEKYVTEIMMRTAPAPTLPHRFRFAGMKSALMLGYGKEGRVSEAFVKEKYPLMHMGVADESIGEDYLEAQDHFDITIKTPGIPKEQVHAHYTTATNQFFARFPGTIIGVTGSKGKSTTTSLIHAILLEAKLPARLAGNIGSPMLELLMEGAGVKTIAVLELSSYQLDDIEYSPHIAVVTNLFPEHMDYHGSIEKYYGAKQNITALQSSGDSFIYNQDVPELRAWAGATRAVSRGFDELPFDRSIIPLLGEHNVMNVRAAVTVARQFHVADETIERAVKKFKGLPHRLELVGEFQGIRFYDDAISTTPESTIAALEAIPDAGTIFLGGHDRGYDFAELEKEIRARGIKNIVLFPESGKRMFVDRSVLNILETTSMREAVAFAYKNTPEGQACLLSCASPSYGLWKNFEEKGEEFQREVKSYQQVL